MRVRAPAATLTAALASLLITFGRSAHGQVPSLPGPLDAMALFEQIERRNPGALDLESWLEIERCLDEADAPIAERLHPLLAELERSATAQSWFNWPVLKPKPVRELRDRCIDLEVEIDKSLLRGAIEALRRREEVANPAFAAGAATPADGPSGTPLMRSLRDLERRRIRELLPPWSLLDASPVDLDRIASRHFASLTLDDGARREISRELESWAEARASECLAQRALRRDAFDRLEAKLVAQGVDLDSMDDPRGAWMVAAFDAWDEVGGELERSVRGMIDRDRRTMSAIAQHLPEAAAAAWFDAVLSLAHRVSGQDNRAFAGDDFARALRLKGLSPEARARIVDGLRRWSMDDAARVRRWCDRFLADAPLYSPLTYEHWGPAQRYAHFQPRRIELDHERIGVADSAISELKGVLGANAAILDDGVVDGDERLEPLPAPPNDGSGWRDPDAVGWSLRPNANPFPVLNGVRSWFDPGPLDERDFARLLRWFDLGEDATATLAMLHRDRTLEFMEQSTPPTAVVPHSLGGPSSTGWRFEDSKYRYDKAAADRIVAQAIERASKLREVEREVWDAALGFAKGDAPRARILLAGAARDIELRLEPFVAALSEESFDRRGEVSVPSALLASCLRAFEAASRDGAAPDREAENRLLESFAGTLDPFLDSLTKREEVSGAAARNLVRFRDEVMWAGATARSRLERELLRLRDADDPPRDELVRAQEALIERLRGAAQDGNPLARDSIRAWHASVFPLVHAREPSCVRTLDADAAKPSALRERFEQLRRWHESKDAALADAAMELCIETRRASGHEAPKSQALDPRLRSMAQARREAGLRAEIRRILLWRSVGVEMTISATSD